MAVYVLLCVLLCAYHSSMRRAWRLQDTQYTHKHARTNTHLWVVLKELSHHALVNLTVTGELHTRTHTHTHTHVHAQKHYAVRQIRHVA